MFKYDGLGLVNLARLLLDFVESHFQVVFDLHLHCKFVCHMTNMHQAGLVTHETMVDTIIHIQKRISNRSPRCLDWTLFQISLLDSRASS